MGKLYNRALLLSKAEAQYGVDAGIASTDGVLAKNLDYQPAVTDVYERDHVRPNFGHAGQLVTATHSTASFNCELSCAAGGAGFRPALSELLLMCSLSETITQEVADNDGTVLTPGNVIYAPISDVIGSSTLAYYLDGLRHRMLGARGSFELTFAAGAPPDIKFSAKGLFVAPDDSPLLLMPSYSGYATVLPVNKRNTVAKIDGSVVALDSLTINMGNTVEYINRPGAEYVDITGRKVVGSISIETTSIAYKNWFSIVNTSTMVQIFLAHGTSCGNIIELNAAHVYLTNPKYSNKNGVSITTFDLAISSGISGTYLDFTLKFR